MSRLYTAVCQAWKASDPFEKTAACSEIQQLEMTPDDVTCFQSTPLIDDTPGRPDRPELVEPRQLKRRRLGNVPGRAALLHAIAHIEFNAINLALDAALRFRSMPAAFYSDWLSVAIDEARHFTLLANRLSALGYSYGDFPAHNGLWEMAEKTAHDVLIRMALVPRVLEARGLDVTPAMINKLAAVDDHASVDVLKIILHEEVRHVEIGSYWFRFCCAQQGVDADSTFAKLLDDYFAGGIKAPLNVTARRAAAFSDTEMDMLQKVASG